jgi:hypothetical protein
VKPRAWWDEDRIPKAVDRRSAARQSGTMDHDIAYEKRSPDELRGKLGVTLVPEPLAESKESVG